MTTELKNKIDLLIVDLQEYRDGNDNISDFHIVASLMDVKDDICDGVLESPERVAKYWYQKKNDPRSAEQHTFYVTK